MKKRLRRAMAMVLTVSMVMSMIGIVPAFADEETDSYWQIATLGEEESNASDTDEYAYYSVDDETGATNDGLSGENPSYDWAGVKENAAGALEEATSLSDADASVQVYKTITGTDVENIFDIELKVVTNQDFENLEISPDAAVVLVFDNSMSMGWDTDGNILYVPVTDGSGEYGIEGSISFSAASKDDTAYWKKLTSDESASDYDYSYTLSGATYGFSKTGWVVTENSNSTYYNIKTGTSSYFKPISEISNTQKSTYGTWTLVDSARMIEAQTEAEKFIESFAESDYDCTRMVSVVQFALNAETVVNWTDVSDPDELEDVIDEIDDMLTATAGGTNIDAGLTKANDLITGTNKTTYLKNADGDAIDSIYVVLLSDGAPTYYLNSSGNQSGSDSTTTHTETYAAANLLRTNGAVVYTVAFAEGDKDLDFKVESKTISVGDWLSDYIASKDADGEALHVDAAAGEDLEIAFEDIVEYIKRLASAWVVTDPMGEHISLVADEDNYTGYDITGSDNVSVKNNTITWELRNDVESADKDDNYTYELRYSIELNTTDTDFEEETYYLTNGETTLQYMFLIQKTGAEDVSTDLTPINFLVPAVKGEYPIYTYNVEHWVQTGTETVDGEVVKTYELDKDYFDTAKMHDDINAEHDASYLSTYTLNTGSSHDEVAIEFLVDEYTFRFYYDLTPTTVTVNHYYTTYTINQYGVSDGGVTVNYPESITEPVYIGQDYTAYAASEESLAENAFTQYASDAYAAYPENYEPKTDDEDEHTIELVAKAEEGNEANNVINFYYEKTIDNTMNVNVVVEHEYTEWAWTINATTGKYELAETGTVFYGDEDTATQKYGTTYAVSQDNSFDGGVSAGYTIQNSEEVKTITLTNGKTVVTLEYSNEDSVTIPTAETGVTVTHIYQSIADYIDSEGNTISLIADDGEKVFYYGTAIDDYATDTHASYYAGESFAHPEKLKYEGNDYELNGEYDNVRYIAALDEDEDKNTITIYYIRDGRTEVDVEVYHTYTFIAEYLDSNGDVKKSTSVYSVDTDSDLLVFPEGTFYEGDYYRATAQNTYDNRGYKMTTDRDDLIVQLTSGTNVIEIDYLLKSYLDDDASVVVTHTYNVYENKYVNGIDTPVLVATYDDREDDEYTGSNGERYFIPEYTEYGGETYTRVDTNAGYIYLESGVTQTIDLVYEIVTDNYIPAGVTVYHDYTTTHIYIDENGDMQTDVLDDEGTDYNTGLINSTETMGTLYEGMNYVAGLDTNPLSEETAYSHVSGSVTKLLEAGDDNAIYLGYTREINDLVDASVKVIYHYTTYTTSLVNGVPETNETQSYSLSWYGVETGFYAGEFYTGTTVTNGFTELGDGSSYTDVELGAGLNILDIYYDKTIDNTADTTLDVTHVYTTKYESGKADDVDVVYDPQITGLYATNVQTFVVNTYDDIFDIDEIDSEQSFTESPYTVTLEDCENAITIYYERTLEDRDPVDVTVIHYYSVYDEYTEISTPEGETEPVTTVVYMLYDDDYTADLIRVYGDYTYDHVDGDRTITLVDEDGVDNVIKLYYQRTVSSEPEVEDEDEDEDNGGSSSSTKYYTLTVNWVDQDGDELDDQDVTKNIKSGTAYDTEEKSFDGYNLVNVKGDSTSGYMTSNKTVTYVYEAEEITDVPDDDVPLTDTPDNDNDGSTDPDATPDSDSDTELTDVPDSDVPLFEIPGLDIPLFDIPQTGDERNVYLMLTTAVASAAGLAWLIKLELDEKKKRNSTNG